MATMAIKHSNSAIYSSGGSNGKVTQLLFLNSFSEYSLKI